MLRNVFFKREAVRTDGTKIQFHLDDIVAVAEKDNETDGDFCTVYGLPGGAVRIAETPAVFLTRIGIKKDFCQVTQADGSLLWVEQRSIEKAYVTDPSKLRKHRRRPSYLDLVSFIRNYQTLTWGVVLLIFGVYFSEFQMSGWEFSIFYRAATYAELFREFGFAFLIAFVISMAIERAAHREFNDTINLRITELQHAVFKAIYFHEIEPKLIAEVEETIFRAPFMRHNHHQTYHLTLISAKDLDPNNPRLPDFQIMKCDMTMSYEVRNISREDQDFTLKIAVESTHPVLRDYVRIHKIKINGVDAEIPKTSDSEGFRHFERIIKNIPPGGRVKITAAWQALKDPDDTEVWRSFYPSDGMTLGVHFPEQVRMRGAHALHRQEITSKEIEGSSYAEWSIDNAVLPHQGIVFWWRTGAEPQLLAPPITSAVAPDTAASAPPNASDTQSGDTVT